MFSQIKKPCRQTLKNYLQTNMKVFPNKKPCRQTGKAFVVSAGSTCQRNF